jgi:hypothetical protein
VKKVNSVKKLHRCIEIKTLSVFHKFLGKLSDASYCFFDLFRLTKGTGKNTDATRRSRFDVYLSTRKKTFWVNSQIWFEFPRQTAISQRRIILQVLFSDFTHQKIAHIKKGPEHETQVISLLHHQQYRLTKINFITESLFKEGGKSIFLSFYLFNLNVFVKASGH